MLFGIGRARFDRLVVMDADLSHPPERIADLLHGLDGDCDMVVGSRYTPAGVVDRAWSPWRFLASRVATALARPLTSCSDPMAGFFAIDRRALPESDALRPVGYKIGLELMVRGRLRVREVPIDFQDRNLGSSKMSWRQQLDFLRHLYRLYAFRHGGPVRLLCFGFVGASGFVIDVACYLGLQWAGVEHRLARLFSFLPAVTWNWLLNRRLTFAERPREPRMHQWTKFVASSLVGLIANVGSYAVLTSLVGFFDRYRLLALVAGVGLGGAVNFLLATVFVYRRHRAPGPGPSPRRGSDPDPGPGPSPGPGPGPGAVTVLGTQMATTKSPRPKRRERRAAARAAARATSRAGGGSPEAGGADPPGPPGPGGTGGNGRAFAGLSRHVVAGVATLAVLVAASYFPALSGGFVWDDIILTDEPVIRAWRALGASGSRRRTSGRKGTTGRSSTPRSGWRKSCGGSPRSATTSSTCCCTSSTVLLVWRLVRRLEVPGAWAVAAVFAVHPLHVESVAWVIERKDLLSALFYLSAVLAWIRFDEAPHPARYGLALVLFTAGLLSKSIVVTLPAALLIWHWWQRGRVTGNDALRLAPLFVIGLCITAADLAFYTSREPLALGYSLAERPLIAARALWFYTGKLLWPTDLAVIYPRWDIRVGDLFGWLYVAAAAGLAGLLWAARHRIGRGPLAGAAYFAVTLSPVLGFVDYGYMQFSFVADRFQYLAGIGVMAVLVGGATHGANRLSGGLRIGAMGGLAVALVLLGTLTWRQAGIYRDPITFFSHIVSHNPEARDAHLNLGSALLQEDRVEEGHAASLVAVAQRPGFAGGHDNLGRALLLMGRFDEAERHLSRALELDPRKLTAQQNTAELRRKQGRFDEAIEWFRKVTAKEATNALAHAGLGAALYDAKRYEEAIESIDRALALEPELPQARSLLGMAGQALKFLGRREEAERRFRQTAEMDPGDPSPLVDLAALRIAERRFDEADEILRRALALAPDNTAALQNVAEGLRKRGRLDEAIESYRAVLAIDPDFAMAHAGIGDALFRLERYEEALESLGRSVSLHPHPPTATARLILMGKASRALGRAEAAVEHFERAVETDPRNPEALDHLALTRFEEKRYEEALDLYRTMLEVRPDSARTHSNLGSTNYHLGRPEEASRSFERALELNPDLPAARTGLDELREAPGRSGE